MKAELKKILKSLDLADKNELQWSLSIAENARKYMRNAEINLREFEARMGLKKYKGKEFIGGTFPYDLKTVSKLEALMEELSIELLKDIAIQKTKKRCRGKK